VIDKLLGLTWLKAAIAGLIAVAIGISVIGHVANRRATRLAQVEAAIKQGREAERKDWVAARDAEMARQAEVSAKAVSAALAEVSRLNDENAALEAALKEAEREAALDPDAGRACLGDDSLRRLR